MPEQVEQNRGRMVSEVLPAGLDVIAGVNSARGAGGIADDDARQAAHHRRPGNTPPERAPGRGTKWTRVGETRTITEKWERKFQNSLDFGRKECIMMEVLLFFA